METHVTAPPSSSPEPPVITLALPYPPSVNHTWRWVGRAGSGGKARLSKETRLFRGKVWAIVARARWTGLPKTLTGSLHVRMLVSPPDRRRRDLDNLLKAVLDALEKAEVYRDDAQIDRIEVLRCTPVDGGRVTVEIRTLSRNSASLPN